MSMWILERLFDQSDQQTPLFAFQGTINWMRSLSLLVDTESFSDEGLKRYYSKVSRRSPNPNADTVVFENFLMAFHNVSALSSFNSSPIDRYDVVRAAVISWYYTVYCSCSAMVAAASGAKPETHARTAKVWQRDIVDNDLAVSPFSLSLNTLVTKEVEKTIKKLRDSNSYDLNTYAKNENEAWGGVCSYLSGTADYEKRRITEKLRSSNEFKKLGVSNFRKKIARELRDKHLAKGMVNFLVQSFRYRGKANYRDSIYLSYGDNREKEIKKFISDLLVVSTKFIRMAAFYSSLRVKKGTWHMFIDDLNNNSRLSINVNILSV